MTNQEEQRKKIKMEERIDQIDHLTEQADRILEVMI